MGRHCEQRFWHVFEVTTERIARFAMQHFPLRLDSVTGLDFGSFSMQIGRFHDIRFFFVNRIARALRKMALSFRAIF